MDMDISHLITALPAILTTMMYIWSRAKAKTKGNTKPGYKTTEFWLTAGIDLLTVVKGSFFGG